MPPVDLLWNLLIDKSSWAGLAQEDLSTLVPLAVSHGVAPLLYLQLSNIELSEYSPAIQYLKKSFYENVARSQVLQLEMQRLDTAFQAASLPYLPLKGAALAWTVYPDPALRPMNDLDLLVQPEDLMNALRLAQSSGYRLDKVTNHAVLRGGPAYTITLELHWCLPGGAPLNFDLPNASKNLRSKFFEAFTYLYCILHLARQHPDASRLIWLYDLHLLRPRLDDQTQLTALAGQLGLSAEELNLLDNFSFPPKLPARPAILGETKKAMQLLPVNTGLCLFGALLFPSKEYMQWRYQPEPKWLWLVYYPLRWVNILQDR